MNTCVNCQAQNPSDYQFCQYCGNKMLAIAIEEVTLEKNRPTNHPKDHQKDLQLVKQLNSLDQPLGLKNPLEENLPEIDLSINNFADPMELSTTTIPYQNFRIADLEIDDLEIDNFEIDDFEVLESKTIEDEMNANHDLALINQPTDDLPTIITKRAIKTNISAVTKIVVPPEVCLQSLSYAGKTDVGKQRDRNEDDFVTIFQTRSIDGKSQVSDRSDRGLLDLLQIR